MRVRALFTKFDPLYPSRIQLKPNRDWRILGLNWVNLSEKRSNEDDVRNSHVLALTRQIRVHFGLLFCHDRFHDCAPLDFYLIIGRRLAINPIKILA